MSQGHLEGERLAVTEGLLKDDRGKIVYMDRHKRQVTLEIEFGEE